MVRAIIMATTVFMFAMVTMAILAHSAFLHTAFGIIVFNQLATYAIVCGFKNRTFNSPIFDEIRGNRGCTQFCIAIEFKLNFVAG